MHNNLKKSFFWNTLGSGLSSINSLFFMIIVTRINGIKEAGIFTLCYATACMFYIIATYSGRTYQVTESNAEIKDLDYIINRIIAAVIMLVVSLLFGVINKYAGTKMTVLMLLCLLKAFEAICDVFHGIIQKNERLDIVGKSLFIRSILNALIFLMVDLLTKNLILACISLIIVDIAVLIAIDIKYALKYKDKSKKKSKEAVIKIFILGFFTFGFSFIANYLVNAPRYAIDSIMSEEFQTIFGIIVMPATIIMLINQFIIQPIITTLKNNYIDRNKKAFLSIIYKVIGLTILTGFMAIIVAYFLGIPVLNLLYGIKLNNYLYSLLYILFGATLYTCASVLSNGLIVLRKTKIQLLIYLISSLFAFWISYKLVNIYGFSGAVYSYVLTMLLLLILYVIYFVITINKENIWEVRNERKN